MNSPPEALSPSPSTPSSGSPSPDDATLPTPVSSSTPTAGPSSAASPTQAKRRLPASSSSVFAGRENKSRRRGEAAGARVWDAVRMGDAPVGRGIREELVDVHMVEYVRNMYGDPFDDSQLEMRSRSS